MKKLLFLLILCSLILTSSCYASNEENDEWKKNTGSINLSEKTATLNEGIEFSDGNVNITKGGDYTVKGTLTDSMIYINTTEKVKLRLNGVNITNSTGSAIFFDNVEKGFITIEEGSENFISDASPSGDIEADAAIFSNDDLEIKGSGSLTINGNYKHGIASDDDVSIQNGNIKITSVEHGIKANNKVEITGGNITILSNGGKGLKADEEIVIEGGVINIDESEEGMESEGTIVINDGVVNITASDDGINTGNADTSSQFENGGMKNKTPNMENGKVPEMPDFNEGEIPKMPNGEMIRPSGNAGGRNNRWNNKEMPQMPEGFTPQLPNENMEQMSEGEMMPKPNGNFGGGRGGMMGGGMFGSINEETATAHAITINGGTININAGGDGIDSNGNLLITDGTITISGPLNNGNGAIDYQGSFSITGGEVIALSSAGMVGTPNTDENQNGISITFDKKQNENTTVTVKDNDENIIASLVADKQYQYMFLSSDKIEEEKEYSVYIDDTLVQTFTAQKGITKIGNNKGGMFGSGGNRSDTKGEKTSGNRVNGQTQRNDIKIKLNGTELKFNQSPVIKNSTTLVPLRTIFEALGMEVNWDDETKTVTATKDDTVITLQIGNKIASVNENKITLNTEPEIISSFTMVPVRFISESVGLNVDWNQELMEVNIS